MRSIRALARRPAFAIVAIATLAIGFGVNAAVFAVTRTVLLRTLPYRDPQRLVQVNERNPARGISSAPVAPINYAAWRGGAHALEESAAFRRVSFNVSTASHAEQVEGFIVSPGFFPLLGVQPAQGRQFAEDEATAGRDAVVLLSDAFWRRFSGADPSILGSTITVDGARCTVIGVLPSTFRLFRVLNRPVDLFRPLVMDPTEQVQSINVWARLRSDEGIEAARSELTAFYASLPAARSGWSAEVATLSSRFAANARPVIVALEWAVALVLLIACANVANLLLAAMSERRTELAVRQALGANPWRLARELGAESLVFVAASSGLAVLVAAWSVAVLNAAVSFQDINRLDPFAVDGAVAAFIAGLGVASILFFVTVTTRSAMDVDLSGVLRESGRTLAGGRSARRLRRALIVAEIGVAIVLTASALTMTRTALDLQGRPRGIIVDGVATGQLTFNDPLYAANPQRLVTTIAAIVERIGSSPGISAASVVNYPPLSLIRVGAALDVEGVPPPSSDRPWTSRYFVVTPRYFESVGIERLAGRDFTAADDGAAQPVAIVSETFARRFWGSIDVIGRRVQPLFGEGTAFWIPRGTRAPRVIVGVVKDVREDGLPDSAGLPQLYLPYSQNPTLVATLMARTGSGQTAAAVSAIRTAVRAVDPALPISYEMSLDDIVSETFARPRELAWVLGTFAALALLLAGGGVYAVMAFMTAMRAQEIAIRRALGATGLDVVRLVVRDALKPAAVGVAAGSMATPLAMRLLDAAVFGVRSWNVEVVGTVAAGLTVLCIVAAALPAWRAAHRFDLPRG